MLMYSSLEISRDTSIESIVSAEEDIGVSHRLLLFKYKFSFYCRYN